jgi:hypothetical protein
MSNELPAVTVVGSINLDLIATAERLPTAGETIGGAVLSQQPGGKGPTRQRPPPGWAAVPGWWAPWATTLLGIGC